MTTILCLDISTSVVGYSVFASGELSNCGYVDLNHDEDLIHRAKRFSDLINFEVDQVVIESPLKSFIKGRTNINTIIKLSQINMLISYIFFDRLGTLPTYMDVNRVRSILGIKKIGNKTKSATYDIILREFDLVVLVNKLGNLDKRNYDISDSIALGYAYQIITNSTKIV